MARREATEKNLLEFQDNLSNSTLGLYYRIPTTKERQQYINKRQVRVGKKFVDNSAALRVEMGDKIAVGVRHGDFERTVDGQYQPISSDEGHADYYPEWREWLKTNAPDILTALAVRVFEMSVFPGAPEGEEDEDELEKE